MKTDVRVEIYYSAAWHDITADVLLRDPIRITRGRADQVSRIPPSTFPLSIKNRDGKYSPRNPTSPLYGLIGRNTPIRVSVGGSVRVAGEIESWPQRWNVSGTDVWVPITANGRSRRLNAPGTTSPSLSALRRGVLGILVGGLLAYWPLEEGQDATRAASAVDGGPALVFTSAVTPGSVSDQQPGSLPYAVLDNTDAGFRPVALPTSTAGFFSFFGLFKGTMPRPSVAKAVIFHAAHVAFASGSITDIQIVTYARWTGTAFDASNTGVDVLVTGGTSFGSVIGGVGTANMYDGRPHNIQVRLDQQGANVVGELWVDGVMFDTATSVGGTLGAGEQLNPPTAAAGSLGGTAVDNSDTTLAFGHYAVHAAADPGVASAVNLHAAVLAYAGETAAARISQLCSEEGIAFGGIGDPALSELVGVQRAAPLVELLNDAAAADDGILYEPRGSLGFTYRTHRSLYNQPAALTLNYAAGGEVAPPLLPDEDTDATANDVTVTRYRGSSSRAIKETGTLNVQEPGTDPDAVGRYEKEETLVLHQDSQTFQHAYWKRHLGTWDEARFPVVVVDLTAMLAEGKTTLAAEAAALNIGDRFVITNPPGPWLPPDPIELIAQGFAETIESHHWTIAINATPARPYDVAELDSVTLGRLDSADTTLNEALDTTETGVDVISVDVAWGNQFPYDIGIGGERMTVTARSGAGLTQTLTVTRSVNGEVKSHASGAPVRLWNAARLAR